MFNNIFSFRPFLSPPHGAGLDHIYRSRAMWALALLTITGIIIRCYGGIFEPYVLYFGQDDYGHLKFSGYKPPARISTDLIDIFFASYRDAHPPLRNIVLNLILRISDNLYYARFVAIIPGVLLILAMFYLGLSVCRDAPAKYRYIASIFCAFMVAVMSPMVLWSIETRPYMLMLLFQVGALICLLQYARSYSLRWLTGFFCCALLSIFSDYSVVISIGIYTLIVLYISCKRPCPRRLLIMSLIGGAILMACMLFQYWQMQHFGTFDNMTGETQHRYIASNYMDHIQDIPKHFFAFFQLFVQGVSSTYKPIASSFIGILYLCGLWLLYRRKSYALLIISGLPIILAFILAYSKLFPFGNTRHCLYLMPSVAIALLSVGRTYAESRFCRYPKTLLLVLSTAVLAAQGIFNTPEDYYEQFTSRIYYHTSPISEQGFADLSKRLIWQQARGDRLLMVDRMIQRRLGYYRPLSKLNRRMMCNNDIDCIRSTPLPRRWKKNKKTCIISDRRWRKGIKWQKDIKRCIHKKEENAHKRIVIMAMHYNEKRTRKTFASMGYKKPLKVHRGNGWTMMVYKRR